MILKICGITNQDDADAAVDAGANAIGFNFYPRSPRFIGPERAGAILTPPGVRRVGVFVNEPPPHVQTLALAARLDIAQLHGSEQPADYPAAMRVWKAARVGDGFDFSQFDGCPAEALLLDGPASGETFDWAMLDRRADGLPYLILAGGLEASNVARAIELIRPWGVDACSRIEASPGKKDHLKMKAFLKAARAALGQ